MTWDEPRIRPKRRWVGMTIALAVFLALVVATVIIGEKLGRDFLTGMVKSQIGDALGVDGETAVMVDLGSGFLIGQAVSGGIDGVHITSKDVPIGAASAEVSLTATGVPINPSGSISTLSANVVLDAADLLALSTSLTDAPVSAVDVVDGTLVLTTTTSAAGQELPVTVSMAPSAGEGFVAFTVSGMTVNGGPVDVAAAQAGSYGPAAAAAATPRSLCVAAFLPAALTLNEATIAGDTLVLGLSGANVPISGGGLGSKGECAAP